MELQIYRHRRLPHWRMPGATYLVTWRLWINQAPLSDSERTLVASALAFFHGQRYTLHAYVVMDDHVHAVVEPLGDSTLQGIIHSWKSFSAKQIINANPACRCAPVWQDEYYDHIVRDDRELEVKVNYILDNPFRRWPDITEYAWRGTGTSPE